MAENTLSKYNAPALDKGLDILEHLSKEGIPMSQVEIAQGINKTPSEIYRMLVCLEERGYLIRGNDSGKYRLSLKMYSLSHQHTPFDELKRIAYYPMQELTEIIKDSCHLSIMDNNKLLVISQIRSPRAVSLSIEEGTHFPISKTTSGKVILTMYSDHIIKEILMRDEFYPKWDKKSKTNFLNSLNTIKKDGFHYSESLLTSGVTDIAIPVGDSNSEICSVLAVSVFTSSLKEKNNIQSILDVMKKTQQRINQHVIA
jgi:DNA-binding IclR family transcriptional regulator